MIKRDKAYSQRYGEVLTLPSSLWNETLETLLAHRSIRVYEDKTLEAGTLELLIAAAQSAASSSNLQAWSVVAVEDAERKKRLAQYSHYARKSRLPRNLLIPNAYKATACCRAILSRISCLLRPPH